MNWSRRVFMKTSGMALVTFGLDPLFLETASASLPHRGADRGKTLICLFQRGAVDGLSMLVPHADPDYYAGRTRTAIPRPGQEGGAIDLDGRFGFHPALAPLAPLYSEGVVAPIHAVGSPDPTRSHFDAQDYMENGTPGVKSTRDGWLNRQIAHSRDHADTPFRGVAFGNRLPRVLRGSAATLAIDDLSSYAVGNGPRSDLLFEDLYGPANGILASSSAEAFEAVRLLRAAEAPRTGTAAGYPDTSLGRSLSQLAQLIKMDVGLEIGFADVGGWDTHVNQGGVAGQLADNLARFGQALAAFYADLGDMMDDVLVLTMSEFGRTVAENGAGGTDHGHGTAMMVIGNEVAGGTVHGNWPTLAEEQLFQQRDLAVTTDFRDLFSEVLVRHLGATDLESVFPGHRHDVANWPGVLRG